MLSRRLEGQAMEAGGCAEHPSDRLPQGRDWLPQEFSRRRDDQGRGECEQGDQSRHHARENSLSIYYGYWCMMVVKIIVVWVRADIQSPWLFLNLSFFGRSILKCSCISLAILEFSQN